MNSCSAFIKRGETLNQSVRRWLNAHFPTLNYTDKESVQIFQIHSCAEKTPINSSLLELGRAHRQPCSCCPCGSLNFAKWINVEPMSGQRSSWYLIKQKRNLLGENSNYTRAKDRRGRGGEAALADEVCTLTSPYLFPVPEKASDWMRTSIKL